MSTNGMTVLVVEDDADVREVLTELLTAYGYHVVAARDGQEGMRVLLQTRPRPAAIVLDLMMPAMNGYEFLKVQKNHAEIAGIPVIVLTADQGARSRVEALGAAAFLGKPPLLDDLVGAVGRCCKHARAS